MSAFMAWRGAKIRCILKQSHRQMVTRRLSWQPRQLILQSNGGNIFTKFTGTRGQWRVLGVSGMVRHSSDGASSPVIGSTVTDVTAKVSQIDPATVTMAASPTADVTQVTQQFQEIPFSELGLGSWTPVGLMQSALEFLHINLHLPWWSAIIVGTVVARILIFPIVIKGQRYSANLNNNMPRMKKLTDKLTVAKSTGSNMDIARANHDLQTFMKTNKVNPLKNFLVPLAQAPIFISFFIGLRKMAMLPVDSMKCGGLFWFTDLTVADPYYILPVTASLTMMASIELGGETGVQNPQAENMKTVFRLLPIGIFPFIMHMPSAVFTYWCASNFITLGQVGLLRIPKFRKYFNIPDKVRQNPDDVKKSGGLLKSMTSGWNNAKAAAQLEDHGNTRARKHREAGVGPVPQTFYYDPTQSSQTIQPMSKMSSAPTRRKAK
ncbi:mitochondrial inner membrane protein OXA1L-like [Glandiceps talaboti]